MARGTRTISAEEVFTFLNAAATPGALHPSGGEKAVHYSPLMAFCHLWLWDDATAARQWRLEQAARLIETVSERHGLVG